MFQIELSDPAEAEAIISNNITCPQTGIIFKVEEFRTPILVLQCYNCQNFGHSAKIVKQKLDVSSVEKATHTKDVQTEKKQPKCANCKGPHVANYKGCPAYKKQVFRQHLVTADQLVKFIATVAIQIAQPQVCYTNAPKDAVDKKSSLCQ